MVDYMVDYIVILSVGFAALIDLKTRRIPNWLTLTLAASAVVGSFLAFGWESGFVSLIGLLVGYCVFLLPFMLGGMGGGDVKLMGAIGALKGSAFVVKTALFGALWGGLLALLVILVKKRTQILERFGIGLKLFVLTRGRTGKELMKPAEDAGERERLYVPYGVAIFLGLLTSYFVKLNLLG